MDVEGVLGSYIFAHLADGLEEGQALDIPDRSPDFHDDQFRACGFTHGHDAPLDLVRHVGDHLDGASQIVPSPFLGDDFVVDLSGRHIVGPRQVLVDKALVVAQVQVRLRPVLGDEDLPVLIGGHGPRVHVQVGVQFLDGNVYPSAFEHPSQRGRGHPFSQRTDHTTGDENVLGHRNVLSSPAYFYMWKG